VAGCIIASWVLLIIARVPIESFVYWVLASYPVGLVVALLVVTAVVMRSRSGRSPDG
jgi:hypothetical protein